jgi:hypothetical protein
LVQESSKRQRVHGFIEAVSASGERKPRAADLSRQVPEEVLLEAIEEKADRSYLSGCGHFTK